MATIEYPDHLLSIAEYTQLGETEQGYTELLEGRLLMSPSPTPRHNLVVKRLSRQLDAQLPNDLETLQDIDIDLELAPRGHPGFSRRPDLIVVRQSAVKRVDSEGGMLRASEVVIVGEIVSPGSVRTDCVAKRGEYAEAAIPHYWIIDATDPISLIDCFEPSKHRYRDSGEITEVFRTTDPFPLTIDLTGLW
ncbi:MAG TPA: Uma2 family endonuclease [Pseudonocardiaceae bacterium]